MPSPLNLDFLPFVSVFLLKFFSLGPQNQEDPMEKIEEAPHVEASLVVGANTSVAPSESALP